MASVGLRIAPLRRGVSETKDLHAGSSQSHEILRLAALAQNDRVVDGQPVRSIVPAAVYCLVILRKPQADEGSLSFRVRFFGLRPQNDKYGNDNGYGQTYQLPIYHPVILSRPRRRRIFMQAAAAPMRFFVGLRPPHTPPQRGDSEANRSLLRLLGRR